VKSAVYCINETSLTRDQNIGLYIAVTFKQYDIVKYLINKCKNVIANGTHFNIFGCAAGNNIMIINKLLEYTDESNSILNAILPVLDIPEIKQISLFDEMIGSKCIWLDYQLLNLDSIEKWIYFEGSLYINPLTSTIPCVYGCYTIQWFHYFMNENIMDFETTYNEDGIFHNMYEIIEKLEQ